MLRFMNSACNASRPVTRLGTALGMLTVAGALTLTPVMAKEPAETDSKTTAKAPANRDKDEADRGAMPECLTKLKLSAQQQEQVHGIIQEYDESIAVVWKQFSGRYMQAITMETALLAAIEDGLTEPQREQVRDQRRKTAKHERAMAATSTKVNQAAVKSTEETTKPATTADEGLASLGVSLTDEQEAAADQVQEKYRTQLRSLNRDIQGLHTRLVSLEADKFVEIEKVLTKEQLVQLRQHRQNAPQAPKVVMTKAESR